MSSTLTQPKPGAAPGMPFRDWLGQCRAEHVECVVSELARLSHEPPSNERRATEIFIDPQACVCFDKVGGMAPGALARYVLEAAEAEAGKSSARFFHAVLHSNQERFALWPEVRFPLADRPWPVLSRECQREIEEILGSKATFHPLQANAVRWRAAFRCLKGTGWSLMPLPWRIDCADGRQFKLLKVGRENRLRLSGIAETAEILRGLPFVPAVAHRDPDYLLVEYRSCSAIPDYRTPAFASAFGKCLARLHAHEPGFLTREQIAGMADGLLLEIAYYRPETKDLLARTKARLAERTPDRAPTGIVYADLKPDNFLMDDQNNLLLPDMGSYQRGQLLDVFLIGSALFERLDRDAFREAYLENGGNDALFSDTHYLQLWNAIKMAAFFLRVHARFARMDRSKKRAYAQWSNEKLEQLKRLAEAS